MRRALSGRGPLRMGAVAIRAPVAATAVGLAIMTILGRQEPRRDHVTGLMAHRADSGRRYPLAGSETSASALAASIRPS
jgi:hypothetical protein